ncbi:hypothetical protein [Mucilaginibacter aquariorum]|uniref:DUF998 domain-containing protein n=1 Tax=Mucilaginibacter aquariorum TaxID=2967225 RepID=A0ABT1SXL0_9SPHI|nr:hypothetical protein [Mucilaginibacter aquariorum]MCQ6957091.1 hypothetical protein [Mucilaginibacter aquariorum]
MNQLTEYLEKKNSDLELSYLQIRRAVGVLGIILPIVIVLGSIIFTHCTILEPSISDYYYTIMGDVLVGILCGVSLFLYSYKGIDNWDRISSNLACVFALGIAFFPTNYDHCQVCAQCKMVSRANDDLRGYVHYGSAALFFIILACMSLFLFTRTKAKGRMTNQKRKRNIVYRTCGIIMLVSIAIIASLKISAIGKILIPYKPVFWLETIALWAFGISWLTKGEFLLKDE